MSENFRNIKTCVDCTYSQSITTYCQKYKRTIKYNTVCDDYEKDFKVIQILK
jgi:hypothetical protein